MIYKLKVAATILLNTIFVLLIAELIAFAFSPIHSLPTPKYTQDERGFILPLKSTSYSYQRLPENGGELITNQINSLGLRGLEIAPKEGKRIMVYGDSNIQAVFSNLEKTFCSRLEFYLNTIQNKTSYHVLNSGVQGFGPDQSLLKFTSEIELLKPDIVVLQLFADNDFGDLIRSRIFNLAQNDELIRAADSKEYDPAFTHFHYFFKNKSSLLSIFQHSSLLRLIRSWQDRRYSQIHQPQLNKSGKHLKEQIQNLENQFKIYRYNLPRRYSQFDDSYDLDLAINPRAEASLIKIKLMRAVVKKFAEVAKMNNIELRLLIQPSLYDLVFYHDMLPFPDYRQNGLSQIFVSIANDLNIKYFDLFPVFFNSNPAELYFKFHDDHWNDRGQDLAAKHFAQFLLTQITD